MVDAVVVQLFDRHLFLCKPGVYDVDGVAAVHLAGLAYALAGDADHLALLAVMHDGGCPLREAGSERSGVQVLEEAPQRVVCRQPFEKVDALLEKLAPAAGEVGDFR